MLRSRKNHRNPLNQSPGGRNLRAAFITPAMDLFKTSTTSIVAVILIVSCMGLLFMVTTCGVPTDETTRVQIVQGLFGVITLLGGYYFGASKHQDVQDSEPKS